MNGRKFSEINGSTFERRQFERVFSGRLSKGRYKIIERFCRRYTRDFNCSCSYDCCGHLVHRKMTISYRQNQVVINVVMIYNY